MFLAAGGGGLGQLRWGQLMKSSTAAWEHWQCPEVVEVMRVNKNKQVFN